MSDAAPAGRVLVLGASGTLGRRIVRLLQCEAPQLEVLGACRHPERLGSLPARRLDREDPGTYRAALADVDVLVHAAGPYAHDPRPLVTACLEAGAHYLDLAEDAGFVAGVCEAARATGAGPCVVPGCSTIPGLVRVLAGRFEKRGDVAALDAFLSLGSRNPVSHGLLYGLLRPIGAPGPEGVPWFSELRSFRFADSTRRCFGAYPIAGVADLRLSGRRLPVRLFVGFDRTLLNHALRVAGSLLPHLGREGLERLCRVALPAARAARAFGTREGRLAVAARDAEGRSVARIEVRAVREGLDVPAAPALWATRRLLEADPPAGAVGLERLVSADAALDWLGGHGIEVAET